MTTAHQLSAPELHAIKILAKEADEKRALLVPGKIPLDFGLHITGDLIVNANTDARQPSAPKAVELVAALLSQFGPRKRSSIMEQIVDKGLSQSIVDAEQTLAIAQQMIAELTTHSIVTRRGNVTGTFAVTPVRVD